MKQTSEIAFAPDWLALREPADHAARDETLLFRAAACLCADASVLDLGSGTGSTMRAFAAAGFSHLNWRLYDNDPVLLHIACKNHSTVNGIVGDLRDVANIPLGGVNLVTASALLDLMSQEWVETLAKRLHTANLPFYAALNFDGVMCWNPPNIDDTRVSALFNAHQQRDKGTGIALGPKSGPEAARIFKEQGFEVTLAQSPWTIGPDQAALHGQLLDGIADAVAEMEETRGVEWLAMRKSALSVSQAHIGHTDLLAVPRANTVDLN